MKQQINPFLYQGKLWLVQNSYYMYNEDQKSQLEIFHKHNVYICRPRAKLTFDQAIAVDGNGGNQNVWVLKYVPVSQLLAKATFYQIKVKKVYFYAKP